MEHSMLSVYPEHSGWGNRVKEESADCSKRYTSSAVLIFFLVKHPQGQFRYLYLITGDLGSSVKSLYILNFIYTFMKISLYVWIASCMVWKKEQRTSPEKHKKKGNQPGNHDLLLLALLLLESDNFYQLCVKVAIFSFSQASCSPSFVYFLIHLKKNRVSNWVVLKVRVFFLFCLKFGHFVFKKLMCSSSIVMNLKLTDTFTSFLWPSHFHSKLPYPLT